MSTILQIFIGGELIGGSTDLLDACSQHRDCKTTRCLTTIASPDSLKKNQGARSAACVPAGNTREYIRQ